MKDIIFGSLPQSDHHNMISTKHPPDLSPILWVVLPIVSYVCLYAVALTGFPQPVARTLGDEQGLLEIAQVLFLLLCLGLGAKMLSAKAPSPHPRLRLWIALLMVGCFYTLGEEMSWGQHYLGWHTPPWLVDLNDQQETNLHNVSADMFFRLPRLILSDLPYNLLLLAIYGAGLVYPLYHRGRCSSWYWPTLVCVPWAVFTACSTLPITVGEWIGYQLPFRPGEIQEYFVYGFLFTYFASLDYRWQSHTTATQSDIG
jgi:hypothetical protein